MSKRGLSEADTTRNNALMTSGPADMPDLTGGDAFNPLDEGAPVFTARGFFIRWGEDRFIVEFGDNFVDTGVDRTRMVGVFDASSAKALARALAAQVEQYEARFGPIV
jgi:hypothetical protein